MLAHVTFCLQLVALELLLRGPRFYANHPRSLMLLAVSAAALHVASSLARARWARIALALLVGIALTTQLGVFRYYSVPLDDQVAEAARRSWVDVRPMVLRVLPALVLLGLVAAAIEWIWLELAARRSIRPRRVFAAIVVVVGVTLGGPVRYGASELRLPHAAMVFARAKVSSPTTGRPVLPPLVSSKREVPSVLFVLTESLRATDYCAGGSVRCVLGAEVQAALPNRTDFPEFRAISSYTAISLSALLTGLLQLGPREPILSAPDLFDYVRAARAGDARIGMHYWSAHSGTIFERTDVPSAVDSYVSADTLMGHDIEDVEEAIAGGIDRRLADTCRDRIAGLAPPYVLMTHFSGTHAPYFFDDGAAAFTPFERHVTWSGLDRVHRAYQNAIVEQDRSIARCIRAFVDAQGTKPYVIVFTSDHGEAFGEHSAIHHGQNLYDEQIHVPGFVAYGHGSLRASEEAALEAARTSYLTHLDVLPTILDALGILDHFAMASMRARFAGASLFRPRSSPKSLAVTNCSAMWACPINGWGMLMGGRKLIAQPWDGGWRCMDLRGGEHEVERGRCDDLASASRASFPLMPNGAPNQ